MTLRSGVTGLNVQLPIGQSTQQISIMETGAPLLETTTAEISSTVPQETLKLLPQTGGIPDWQSFLTFLPGTRGNGTNNNSPGMGGVSVNGSMPFSNALLDGASTSSPMSNNVINTPIFDTLGEVKMSSSAFSAQYGGGGMVYNQISKGGSNQFHGMVYDYFKNTALNAAPFGFNGVSFKTPQHFNDFGGNIGGPVIKNKVFFFFGVDHTINHTTPAVSFATVPTLAMRAGNFAGIEPDLRSDVADRECHHRRSNPPVVPQQPDSSRDAGHGSQEHPGVLPATQSGWAVGERHRDQQL